MAAIGGQPGNNNAAKNRTWQAAIERAIAKRSLAAKREALDDLAEVLLAQCDQGDMAALKELGDRLDGRPHQSIAAALSGDVTFATVSYADIKPKT